MTHLERFMNSINRKTFDRIPLNFLTTQEFLQDLKVYLNENNEDTIRYKTFDIDRRSIYHPEYIGPELRKYDDGSYENIYGVKLIDKSYDKGVYPEAIGFPLANVSSVKEIEQYNWPKAEWFDYNGLISKLEAYPDYAMTIGYFALGWSSWEMREMSQFLEDLLINESLASAIIENVFNFGYNYYENIIQTAKDFAGKNFACIHLADDWATQDSLMISPTLFRKYFKRYYKKIVDMAHNAGLLVEFHCCGSPIGLIPDLIDTGFDILNPVQTSAKGMNPEVLKKEFGDYVSFSGGVDVQKILPFSTPEKVREEVFYLLDTIGKDGGYILEPSHMIQPGTPPENVVAMYKAVEEYFG